MTVEWGPRRHGTYSGWRRHQELRERPCDACYAAKQAYDRRYRAAPERTRVSRLHAAAQSVALRRLAALYPDLYREFYIEEKARRMVEVAS